MPTDWSPVVAGLAEQLRTYYLDKDVAERVVAVLENRLAGGAYDECVGDEEFAAAVTEDCVAASGDLHLRLRYSIVAVPVSHQPVVPESGRHPDEARLAGHGFARVERLAGNVALLDVRRFFPTSMSSTAAIAAMHLVAGAEVLIVDLRRCVGGEPGMVALVASFLFDERTPLSALYFPADDRTEEYWTDPGVPDPKYGGSKPVFLLTSSASISAAEGFAYDLQHHGRAVVFGEVTAGAAHFDYRYRVTEHLMFSVPSGYPVNPVTGGHWEGEGVEPDIPIAAEEALGLAHLRALEHVIGLGGAGQRRPVLAEAEVAWRAYQ